MSSYLQSVYQTVLDFWKKEPKKKTQTASSGNKKKLTTQFVVHPFSLPSNLSYGVGLVALTIDSLV